ncbi:MAG: hypothetical protein OXG03_00500 [Gammaproteobacteria bacterium]|nr:hypothetical protein [Gammaproteobacteria bacterium]
MAGKTLTFPRPTLVGWMVADALLVAVLAFLVWVVHGWSLNNDGLIGVIPGVVVGFAGGFVLAFAVHEWGHWVGARIFGARLPFNDYRHAIKGYRTSYRLIPNIDIASLSARQFLGTSWVSILGYAVVSAAALVAHFSGDLDITGAALAVGALAFSANSFVLDLPPTLQVSRGAEVVPAMKRNMTRKKIRRRSALAYLTLALALVGWNLL